MQDSRNLKKKIKIKYPQLIKEAEAKGDIRTADYWRFELNWTKEALESRSKNRKKNAKQYKKAN